MPIKQIIFVEIKHFLLGAACYAHKKFAMMKRNRTYMVSALSMEKQFDKIAKIKRQMLKKKVKENCSTAELIGGENKTQS